MKHVLTRSSLSARAWNRKSWKIGGIIVNSVKIWSRKCKKPETKMKSWASRVQSLAFLIPQAFVADKQRSLHWFLRLRSSSIFQVSLCVSRFLIVIVIEKPLTSVWMLRNPRKGKEFFWLYIVTQEIECSC